MIKISIIIALAVAAGIVVFVLPGAVEGIKHWSEWITLAFTGHHISTEIAHVVHPHKTPEA